MTELALNSVSLDERIANRREEIFRAESHAVHVRTDRMFAYLLLFQYVAGIVASLFLSPRAWEGSQYEVHIHVWAAVLLGGAVTFVPVFLAWNRSGEKSTRHAVAAGQALSSALLIHLSGGRIETHFHIFGSLAFLAFYRDYRVLITATVIVAVDHLLRGLYWPESVFGVLSGSNWRWAEHAAWVLFEDVFLVYACVLSRKEMLELAGREARLALQRELIEAEFDERTVELEAEVVQRRRVEVERDRLDEELVQAQKLEAIGQLAAGIAHEINTPTQFVGDNTRFLKESFGDLVPALEKSRDLAEAVKDDENVRSLAAELEVLLDAADVEFLIEEIPSAIEQSLEGVDRVRKIVQSMKDFSHPGRGTKNFVDLNRALSSTLTVASNEWKYVAEAVTDLDPELPEVACDASELNQVFLNIIVNAAHAIADHHGEKKNGRIEVSTRRLEETVEIRISDNGGGIPEDIRRKIFDPFFTTKEVGRGTGQGLSIAYRVVVERHGGTIEVESEVGVGTTFVITLPLMPSAEPELVA